MPGSYTADEQSAAKMMSAIADSPDELIVGVTTAKGTSSTTSIVVHGLSGAPDFIICSLQADANGPLNTPGLTVNTTSVTFTLSTAQTSFSVAYIIGYTA